MRRSSRRLVGVCSSPQGGHVKKLLLLLIVVAIGAVVAKKVREA
jgi:hypothetical protein